ncbi:addiction module antidote protein, HigA family [Bacteriovorax stolpii]|uniref:Addiction module antidote protein, HigA family n=1 Tax=Bacteriovorax stolpii TaxID=960 RepID=A0A2K9NP88_BACTC|nr:HigA family addiction module antitoxin [Bacteriovorax stolpii]AUN97312.1 addiction module antidote protein, HigA family [Bacteriovorax stolpii]QDK42750.1 addiction module antidote protein, HigA family [Bacteriovorax stolpii]TDP52483.1 addiction module HigA family antidote [Bacteriovorax stolpii]
MNKINYQRPPTNPGEILSEEFLKPLGLTQKELADHIQVDIKVINRLVNGKTTLSAEMALKLASSFQTTPDFWLSAQYEIDLYRAKMSLPKLPGAIIKTN